MTSLLINADQPISLSLPKGILVDQTFTCYQPELKMAFGSYPMAFDRT